MFILMRNLYKSTLLFLSFVFLLTLLYPSSSQALTNEPELFLDLTEDGSSTITQFTIFQNKLYFIYRNYDEIEDEYVYELWTTDGTPGGTAFFKSLGSENSSNEFVVFNNELYFVSEHETYGVELWKTDGTFEGTEVLKDINVGGDSSPFYLTVSENLLYFMAKTSANGWELWKTNGNEVGTNMVKDICPGVDSSFRGPYEPSVITEPIKFKAEMFVDANNVLYFAANDCTNGVELWRSNGEESGTTMVKDINTSGSSLSQFSRFLPVELNNTIYFSANDGVNGEELWKSDGISSGTTMVKDINLSGSSVPGSITVFNNFLYFSVNDGDILGRELWISDGTSVGTSIFKNINADDYQDSYPDKLFVSNDKLFFVANDGQHGIELWVTDGTEVETKLVKNINIDSYDSNPSNFVTFDNNLYFSVTSYDTSEEIWKSDGSSEGTTIVKDVNPIDGSIPRLLTIFNNSLYFVADDGTHGREIWKIEQILPSPTPTSTPSPTSTPTPTVQPTPKVDLKITNINAVEVLTNVFAYYYPGNTNIKFKGVTHPLAFVRLVVNSDPKICETTADSEGNFECIFPYIEDGIHKVTVTATTVVGEVITYPEMTLGINVKLEDTGNSMIKSPLVGFALIFTGIYIVYLNKSEVKYQTRLKVKIIK